MIYSIKGNVQELAPTSAVLETGGIGYLVNISLQTSAQLSQGQQAFLFIRQIIREDAHLLYGFHTTEERDMFSLLISVSGVGPASAIIMLSSLTNNEIATAITSGQSGVLQRVKGIGAKTAERIIVDLRDKVKNFAGGIENISIHQDNKVREEALSALEVLGIPKKSGEKIADRFLKQNPDISVEDLVKQILKNI